ncbi:hypothetical protein [Kitasatospora sp. NPDC059571]|uniref:hypothetical protein n=1 Tax=Kitasatospora sp. NPDC059571 TaxID=3346871 RepID=UPI0036C5BC36
MHGRDVSRTYAYPGKRDEMLSFYRRAATEAGWAFEANRTGTPDDVAGICFTKVLDGRWTQPTVDFRVGSGYGPEVGAYRVEPGSAVDGSAVHCY